MSGEIQVTETNQIQEVEEKVDWKAIESAMANNNYAKLSPKDRVEVLTKTCTSLGLNPLTQPFGFYKMKDGSVQLYAKRAAAEQLSKIHGVSVLEAGETWNEKTRVFTVKIKAQDKDGRIGMNRGDVWISPTLTGEDLANQYMRCFTKAHRRWVLSMCGLGYLDETEVEDVEKAEAKRNQPKSAQIVGYIDASQKELLAKKFSTLWENGLDYTKLIKQRMPEVDLDAIKKDQFDKILEIAEEAMKEVHVNSN